MSIEFIELKNPQNYSLPSVVPLTKESEKTLMQQFFGGERLEGGAKVYNDLALRTKTFCNLQTRLKEAKENLKSVGFKEKLFKGLAISLCVVLAIAAVALAALSIAPLALGITIGFTYAHLFVSSLAVLGMGLTMSGMLGFAAFIVTKSAFTYAKTMNDEVKLIENKIKSIYDQHQKPSSKDETSLNNLIDEVGNEITRSKKIGGAVSLNKLVQAQQELIQLRDQVKNAF